MKRYGSTMDGYDDGDTLSNCMNAVKSSLHRNDGKGALRRTKQKSAIRILMNKTTRVRLKRDLDTVKKELGL
jgi:hypothetical protein